MLRLNLLAARTLRGDKPVIPEYLYLLTAFPSSTAGSLSPAAPADPSVSQSSTLLPLRRCPIANRLRYLEPPLPLGGDRPSQTAHLALSTARIHGQLELNTTRLVFHRRLTGPEVPGHSLPATLRMLGQTQY